ncbi:hypothetical protein ACD661_08650 [Legionella lytica]|uniref:Substrate of the Dot/Icm secretion system n=1 Tax=Legionella lytica TaxID=96232 RepID=A0ABW8DAL3_9GAMM
MGFFDKAKKFLKEGVNELASDVTEKPQFYKYVEQLVSEITAVQHNKKLVLDPETNDALRALKSSLVAAKDKFDKETHAVHGLTGSGQMSAIKYNKAFHDFCETSVNAIYQHQSTIMAAPGIWNKLKACISNVLEEYLGITNALTVKESQVATSGDFKNRFSNVKFEGKEKMEEIEEKPFSPNI